MFCIHMLACVSMHLQAPGSHNTMFGRYAWHSSSRGVTHSGQLIATMVQLQAHIERLSEDAIIIDGKPQTCIQSYSETESPDISKPAGKPQGQSHGRFKGTYKTSLDAYRHTAIPATCFKLSLSVNAILDFVAYFTPFSNQNA